MNWFYYKIDFTYNDNVEDWQIISSTAPLQTPEVIIGFLNDAISHQVDNYTVNEIWELSKSNKIKGIDFELIRQMYPVD